MAKALLEEHGIRPEEVGLKVLQPFIDGAQLEDDEQMRAKWAGLLASASAGDEVPPAYPRFLAQLSPEEARLLDSILQNPFAQPIYSFVPDGTDGSKIPVRFEHLIALGLCIEVPKNPLEVISETMEGLRKRGGKVTAEQIAEQLQHKTRSTPYGFPEGSGNVQITAFGRDFVRVCRGPRSEETDDASNLVTET